MVYIHTSRSIRNYCVEKNHSREQFVRFRLRNYVLSDDVMMAIIFIARVRLLSSSICYMYASGYVTTHLHTCWCYGLKHIWGLVLGLFLFHRNRERWLTYSHHYRLYIAMLLDTSHQEVGHWIKPCANSPNDDPNASIYCNERQEYWRYYVFVHAFVHIFANFLCSLWCEILQERNAG